MFGEVKVNSMFQLSKHQSLDEAVAKLLQFTDTPEIGRGVLWRKRFFLHCVARPGVDGERSSRHAEMACPLLS